MEGEAKGNEKWTIFEKVHKCTESFTPNSFLIEISEGRVGSYLQLVIVPCAEMERFHLLD